MTDGIKSNALHVRFSSALQMLPSEARSIFAFFLRLILCAETNHDVRLLKHRLKSGDSPLQPLLQYSVETYVASMILSHFMHDDIRLFFFNHASNADEGIQIQLMSCHSSLLTNRWNTGLQFGDCMIPVLQLFFSFARFVFACTRKFVC
jgi:hypothetical protein